MSVHNLEARHTRVLQGLLFLRLFPRARLQRGWALHQSAPAVGFTAQWLCDMDMVYRSGLHWHG